MNPFSPFSYLCSFCLSSSSSIWAKLLKTGALMVLFAHGISIRVLLILSSLGYCQLNFFWVILMAQITLLFFPQHFPRELINLKLSMWVTFLSQLHSFLNVPCYGKNKPSMSICHLYMMSPILFDIFNYTLLSFTFHITPYKFCFKTLNALFKTLAFDCASNLIICLSIFHDSQS